MTWRSIVFGHLRRRMGRACLLVSGLAVGVAMVVALTGITLAMRADVDRKMDEYGANLVIVPRRESVSLSYGGVSVSEASLGGDELRAADARLVRTIESRRSLRAVAPKVVGVHRLAGRPVMIVGVDFPAEFRIKKWWSLQGASGSDVQVPPTRTDRDVVVGSAVASAWSLSAGDRAVLGGREYLVAGVLQENSSPDDQALFMNLGEAQRLLGKEGRLSLIEVSALCSECPIDHIVSQISARLPHARVSAVRQAMALKMQTVDQVTRFSVAVGVVVLAIGGLVVFVSMLSSVHERVREIGVLRALGFRRSHVLRIVLFEAFLVSLAAGVAGWALGSSSVWLLSPQLLETHVSSFSPSELGTSVLLALGVGMLSSLYPAMRASRLDPSEALRHI